MAERNHWDSARKRIAIVVGELRRERRWTQAELAQKLGVSQGRVSQIESGTGSFSAEQLLLILKLFNVTPEVFSDGPPDRGAQMQNALARLGATHLLESEGALPEVARDEALGVVADVLIKGEPRLTAALAPVLVSNIDSIPLAQLHLDLSRAGFERRVPWLCQNVALSLDLEAKPGVSRTRLRQARRTRLLIDLFLETQAAAAESAPWDVLDRTILSRKTVDELKASASEPSRRWHIITSLRPEDFAQALKAAHGDD
jgi:transcriptional regulator with XRE-family HTH domain